MSVDVSLGLQVWKGSWLTMPVAILEEVGMGALSGRKIIGAMESSVSVASRKQLSPSLRRLFLCAFSPV